MNFKYERWANKNGNTLSIINKVHDAVPSNSRISIEEIARLVNITAELLDHIVLGMFKH